MLKGPQGTLFERNTTGGALLLEPHMPEDTFSASIAAEGTNDGGQSYEGMLSLPIVDDKLMARLAAKFLQRDGFTHDVTTGQDLDNKQFWTAHLGATLRLTGRIENQLLGYLLYGKVSHNYKACCGFSVTNYELGSKSDFRIGDVPARVNAALYYSNYTDMQRAAIDANGSGTFGTAIFNVGRAEIYGLELETIIEPFDGLSLGVNYAYTHGKYEKYGLANNNINPQLDCTGALVPAGDVADLKCIPFQAAPMHQARLTAIYRLPLAPSLGPVDGSITYAWTDKQYASAYSLPQAEPDAWLESFGLLNASVSWKSILGSRVDLKLFGTNLSNTKYRISNTNVMCGTCFVTRARFTAIHALSVPEYPIVRRLNESKSECRKHI